MKKYLLGAFLVIAMNLFGAKLSEVKGLEKLKNYNELKDMQIEKINWNKIFENSFKAKSKLAPINKFNLSINNLPIPIKNKQPVNPIAKIWNRKSILFFWKIISIKNHSLSIFFS